MRHASNMLIWTSDLPNAGKGAFVQSQSQNQLAESFVHKDEVICRYSFDITDSELDILTCTAGVLPDDQAAVALERLPLQR